MSAVGVVMGADAGFSIDIGNSKRFLLKSVIDFFDFSRVFGRWWWVWLQIFCHFAPICGRLWAFKLPKTPVPHRRLDGLTWDSERNAKRYVSTVGVVCGVALYTR